jgi:hypothetical protein
MMSETSDFYGYYDSGDFVKIDLVDNLMQYKDETVYKECKQLKIAEDYKYKELCEKILQYYEKYHKLSDKQKCALCCLLYEQGFAELEGE